MFKRVFQQCNSLPEMFKRNPVFLENTVNFLNINLTHLAEKCVRFWSFMCILKDKYYSLETDKP